MPQHTTNYVATLITPAPDSAATIARPPAKPDTVAGLQHQMLTAAPYSLTSDDLLFAIHAQRHAIPAAEQAAARGQFFSRGQPCLRASPLARTHGFGFHFDAKGRVALVEVQSPAFARLMADPKVAKTAAMRSKRA